MNKDALLQVSEIVSHSSCPDGIGAAMVCVAAYVAGGMNPPPTYFIQYDTRAHNEMKARPRQLFVDITPPKARWEDWRGLSPIILDHHESVTHIVQSLDGVYGDSDCSGTTLAFDNIMVPLSGDVLTAAAKIGQDDLATWKRFAHLCMVRDTWKTASPDWAEACALAHALLLQGQKWAVHVATVGRLPFDELINIGTKMYEKIMRQAKGVVRNSAKHVLKAGGRDIKIAFFNHAEGGTVSDIAHHVMDQMPCDVVVGYFYVHEDDATRCVASVRTNGAISASELARTFDGGGHARAAGFRIPDGPSPKQIIDLIIERIASLNP